MAVSEARRKYQRDWDERNRRANGAKPFKPAECGTRSGYNAHLSNETPPCEGCRAANAEYQRERRALTAAVTAAAQALAANPDNPADDAFVQAVQTIATAFDLTFTRVGALVEKQLAVIAGRTATPD